MSAIQRERIIAAHERLLDVSENFASVRGAALAGIVGSLAAVCGSRIDFTADQMRELIADIVEREINQALRPSAVAATEADE